MTLIAQVGYIRCHGLRRAHNHHRSVRAQNNLLRDAAHAPLTQAALPVTAQDDQLRCVGVRKLDDLFGGSPFEDVRFGEQAGFLQTQRYFVQIRLRFGFADLPIERIQRAPPARFARRIQHAQERDLGSERARDGDGMRQHALGERRAI
jgi:hypothetical protein